MLARQVSAKTPTKFDLLGTRGGIEQAAYQKDWAHHVFALRAFPDAGNFPFTE
jgi:aspartate/glutamate racemase